MAAFVDWRSVFSRVRAALRRRGWPKQDADDFLQDAYLKMVSYQESHEVARPDAFLMRIALNLAVDAHRARRVHGEMVFIDDLTVDELLSADASPSAEETALVRERIARLSESMAGLKARTREIYLAHLIEGMTYAEIGAAQGLSLSAVEKHMAKATMTVMRRMEGW